MSCDELKELYELYALGALEAEEQAEIDAHIARECPTCLAGVKKALAVNAVVASFAVDLEPTSRLRQRVLSSVGIAPPRWSWAWTWAAVSAALVIGLIWLDVQDRHKAFALERAREDIASTRADLLQVQRALLFLEEPDMRQVGFGGGDPHPPRGNVFVNSRGGVLLIASNLPLAPRGKAYEMWVIPKGEAPKPAGMFQSDSSGTAFHLIPGRTDIANLQAVAVSIEPESGSVSPTEIVIPPVVVGM